MKRPHIPLPIDLTVVKKRDRLEECVNKLYHSSSSPNSISHKELTPQKIITFFKVFKKLGIVKDKKQQVANDWLTFTFFDTTKSSNLDEQACKEADVKIKYFDDIIEVLSLKAFAKSNAEFIINLQNYEEHYLPFLALAINNSQPAECLAVLAEVYSMLSLIKTRTANTNNAETLKNITTALQKHFTNNQIGVIIQHIKHVVLPSKYRYIYQIPLYCS